jgi:hypothetical protein
MVSNPKDSDLQDRMARLADFLTRQAATLRAEAPADFGYGRGNDRGMAQGYELAAKFIRQELTTATEAVSA